MYEITIKDLDSDLKMHAQTRFIAAMWNTAEEHKSNGGKEIDKLIFPQPRQIPVDFTGEMQKCERPLRASTAQGERISLACSEQIPAGATCEFDVVLLSDDHEKLVREWLDYGNLSGIGQWRNSGMGRFRWEEIPE